MESRQVARPRLDLQVRHHPEIGWVQGMRCHALSVKLSWPRAGSTATCALSLQVNFLESALWPCLQC